MKISDYIILEKKDVISFVGAGGKTTMMFKLAEELRHSNKVLVTTTTKIYLPSEEKYDFICTDKEMLGSYINMKENGIYILGLGVNEENKILGLSEKQLDELVPHFDYILIEADGSKEKPLKGWNEFEPVMYGKTTKTVGIMDIQSLGMVINEDKVHRSKIFCDLTGAKEGDTVSVEHLLSIVMHPQGLFKSAQGKKILYVNKVEDSKELILAKSLVTELSFNNHGLADETIVGSLKTGVYYKKYVK
jgi:probable selenium-dependent hydroxylase accessory protein YqeC